MDPNYEERRTPRSLADMLGLRDRGEEDIVSPDTERWGMGTVTAFPSRLGVGAAAGAIASAGGGNSSRWGMPRGRYRGGSLTEPGDGTGSEFASPSGSTSHRPPPPQQHLRYTSLLEISDHRSHRPRSAGEDSPSFGRVGVDDLQGWGQEDELPTYEEAISQPLGNHVSVPLIAEAERQVPASIRYDHHNIHQPYQPSTPINTTAAATVPQPIVAPSPSTAINSPSTSQSSSRLTRLLRRRHSHDYIRPPPPQEGIPLELVCDKYGNRRRDIVWHGDSNGKVLWLGNLGNGDHGLPATLGFAGRSMRWERRVLRRGGRGRLGID